MKKNKKLVLLLALVVCSMMMGCNNSEENPTISTIKETFDHKENNNLFALNKLKPIPVSEVLMSDSHTNLLGVYENEKYLTEIPNNDNDKLELNFGIYNEEKKEIDLFYEDDGDYHMTTIGKYQMIGPYIFWGEVNYNDNAMNQLSVEIVCIDKKGKKETLITHEVEQQMSLMKCGDSILYITTIMLEEPEMMRCTLQTYNIKEKKHTVIKEYDSKMSPDGKITGTILIATGGTNEENIYYATCELNNEVCEIDKTGITKVYQHNMKTNVTKDMGELPRKVSYLSGGKDYFITSDFASERPLVDTGYIHLIDDNNNIITSCLIPDVITTQDIVNVDEFSNNLIFIQSYMYSYIYDLKTKEFVQMGDFGLKKHYKKKYGTVQK